MPEELTAEQLEERWAACEAANPGSPCPNMLSAAEAAEIVFAVARFLRRHGRDASIETGEVMVHGRRQYALRAWCTNCDEEATAPLTLAVALRIEQAPLATERYLRAFARELLGRGRGHEHLH